MTITNIINDIYRRTKTNSANFVTADILLPINQALNEASQRILLASGWEWDDSNQTDLPTATTALVANQKDYSITVAHLGIERIELLPNGSSTWQKLTQIDQADLTRDNDQSLSSYRSGTGTPVEYDLIGSSIFLYPTPSYSQAASLKVYFQRGPVEFTSADVSTGAMQPGFASLFHHYIPIWVAYDYCVVNIPSLANGYFNELEQVRRDIDKFYALRNRDKRGRLAVSSDSNQ